MRRGLVQVMTSLFVLMWTLAPGGDASGVGFGKVAGVLASALRSARQAVHAPPQAPARMNIDRTPVGGPPTGIKEAPPTLDVRHELVGLRTSNSRTFASQGHLVSMVSERPINFRDSRGRWQAIDDTLVAASNSGWRNRSDSYTVSLPADLGRGAVRLTDGSGWVEFQLEGADARGSAAGDTATYAGALPGVTVRLTAGNGGLKETMTLAGPSAASTFSYRFSASPGLSLRAGTDGSLVVVDPAGTVRFTVPAPFMLDSSGTAAGASRAVRFELHGDASGTQTVGLVADPTWLTSGDRRWPVVIDPSVFTANVSETLSCEIDGGSRANVNACAGSQYQLGFDGTTVRRMLLQFPLQSVFQTPIIPVGAQLQLSVPSDSTSNVETIGAYQLTQPWTSGVTWNTTDGTHAWTTAGGTFNSTPLGTIKPDPSTQKTYAVDGLLSAVQQWLNDPTSNDGVLLEAVDETVLETYTLDAAAPELIITYDSLQGEQPFYRLDSQQLDDRMKLEVNVANGNLVLHETDFTIAGTGLDLSYQRFYNLDGDNQFSAWTNNLGDVFLESGSDGSIIFHAPGGYLASFAWNGSSWVTPPGSNTILSCTTNLPITCTATTRGDGRTYSFAAFPIFGSTAPLASISDRNGNRITLNWNSNSSAVTSVTDTQGRVTSFSYGSSLGANLITKITDPAGRTYQYAYSQVSIAGVSIPLLSSYTDAAGKVTSFSYDTTNRKVQVTDPQGNVTTVTYDSSNRVTSVARPGGATTAYAYSAGSTVSTDPNGHQATFAYDALGRVTKTTDASGHATTTSFNANDAVTQTTDATGSTTTTTLDSSNNDTRQQLPGGASSTTAFSDPNHPSVATQRTDTEGTSSTSGLDTAGNVTKIVDALGHTTTFVYNANGTISSLTDAAGNVTSYSYDSSGNLTSAKYPAPLGTTTYTYDGLSRLATVTDGKGQKTTSAYDALDRVTTTGYADGSSVATTYDADGNKLTVKDSTGTTSMSYDGLNRLVKETMPNGSTISYGYDAAGNLTSRTDSGGAETRAYDALDQLTSLTAPSGAVTTFQYDADHRNTAIVYPNGVTESVQYDAAGDVSKISASRSGTALTSFTYSYTNPASGQATKKRYSVVDVSGNTTAYQYDAMDRLASATTTSPGGSTLSKYSYTYDAVANLASVTANGTTTTLTYNGADEVTGVGSTTYTSDANGDLTGNSAGLAFAYNAQQQTTSVTPPGGTAASMTYRGVGQEQRATAGAAAFQYDVTGLSQMTSGGSTTYFSHFTNGAPLSMTSGGATYYYLHDSLGSVVGLTDSTGALVNRYSYDPFGNIVSQVEKVANPLRWIGGVYDSALELYKLGGRFYVPALGRFTQPDLSQQSVNRFAYSDDDPIDNSDPSGAIWVGWYWWGMLVDLNSWEANWLSALLNWGAGFWALVGALFAFFSWAGLIEIVPSVLAFIVSGVLWYDAGLVGWLNSWGTGVWVQIGWWVVWNFWWCWCGTVWVGANGMWWGFPAWI